MHNTESPTRNFAGASPNLASCNKIGKAGGGGPYGSSQQRNRLRITPSVAIPQRQMAYPSSRVSYIPFPFIPFPVLLSIVILGNAASIYRNTVYTPPKLGKALSTWIFSAWGEEDASFRPQHSTSVSLPLYGSVHRTAYWFADVKLGTPMVQMQSLIADTGSSVMGFPCADCASCGQHADPAYDLSLSTSVRHLDCAGACPLCTVPTSAVSGGHGSGGQCAYHIRYTEGSSLAGKWYTDKVWLDKDPFSSSDMDGALFELPFGCHSEETHLFVSQEASGILGLEGTSRFGPPPFVTAVLADLLGMSRGRSGSVSRNLQIVGSPRTRRTKPVVSICLSGSGGVLTVGDVNTRYHVSTSTEAQLDAFFLELAGVSPTQSPPTAAVARFTSIKECEEAGVCQPPRRPTLPQPPTPPTPAMRPRSDWALQRQLLAEDLVPCEDSIDLAAADGAEAALDGSSGGVCRVGMEDYDDGYDYSRDSSSGGSSKRRALGDERGTSSSAAAETVLRTSVHYFKSLPAGLAMTPLVMDHDEEGGWPGSYVVAIQQAYVRGAAGTTALAVPFAPQPLPVRMGTVNGLPALVDSGTTLTYLPFMLYANLWTALLRNIVAEKDRQQQKRRLSRQRAISLADDPDSNQWATTSAEEPLLGSESVVRVSGTTVSEMQRLVQLHAASLRESQTALLLGAKRDLSKKRANTTSNAGQTGENVDFSPLTYLEQAAETLGRDLAAAEVVLAQIEDLRLSAERLEQEPAEVDPEVWQEMNALMRDPSAKPRALPSRGRPVEPARLNAVLLPDHLPESSDRPNDSSDPTSRRRRRLGPISLPNLEEECWYFANVEQDVQYFPDIKIGFANSAEYVWRPSSFLYRKGKTRVFCLTIIADKSPEESAGGNRNLNWQRRVLGLDLDGLLHASEQQPGSQMMEQQVHRQLGEVRQAVLGSSFCIDYDLVFHLGNWMLGFAEARCPTTDIRGRLKRK